MFTNRTDLIQRNKHTDISKNEEGGEEMEKAYLSVKEAAQYLSANEDTLRGKLQAGVIPAYKVGRLWRIRKDELEMYLEENGNRNA